MTRWYELVLLSDHYFPFSYGAELELLVWNHYFCALVHTCICQYLSEPVANFMYLI